jgi:FkbM family methyltransferase
MRNAVFEFQGIWFPDGEKHFPEWMAKNGELVDGRGTYQIKKFRAAMEYVKNFRIAVDVGAHVGLWSMQLSRRFEIVHAFEPVEAFRKCFLANTKHYGVHLYDCALGASNGVACLQVDQADTGGTHVAEWMSTDEIGISDRHSLSSRQQMADMCPLDDYALSYVDFLKIDCEGFEHLVIEGARETLLRCKPCVIVEQKPHKLGPNFGIKGTPAVDLLKEMGYRVAKEIGGDYIMVV